MDENIIEEKSEKSKFLDLEGLRIWLRIIAIISLLIGVCMLLTNHGTSSTSISPETQTLISYMSVIEIGMSIPIGLISLAVAVINLKKDKPKLAIFFLIAGIAFPLLVWYLNVGFLPIHFIPALN